MKKHLKLALSGCVALTLGIMWIIFNPKAVTAFTFTLVGIGLILVYVAIGMARGERRTIELVKKASKEKRRILLKRPLRIGEDVIVDPLKREPGWFMEGKYLSDEELIKMIIKEEMEAKIL